MILEQETLDKYGYSSNQIKYDSKQEVVFKCDFCGKPFIRTMKNNNQYNTNSTKDCCGNQECKKIKRKEIFLLKYGVDNISQYAPNRQQLRKPQKIGSQFNSLTIIGEPYWEFSETEQRNYQTVLCKCICNTEKPIQTHQLITGHIKSCGCLLKESSRTRATKHGFHDTRLYRTWVGMRARCRDKDRRWYGLKGIKVCKEWDESFLVFKKWAETHGYNDTLTIDRIDPDKDYCPGNCEWVTLSENSLRVSRVKNEKIKALQIENERLKNLLIQNNIKS